MSIPEKTDAKGRRVTIDLTSAAAAEVDRLRDITGLSTADVFRHALSLFRIYVRAKQEGDELEVKGHGNTTRIELPLVLQHQERVDHVLRT